MQPTATRCLPATLLPAILMTAALQTAAGGATAAAAATANKVISYSPGVGAAAGFTNPQAALGLPERFTGEGLFPSVVSPFSPPFLTDEIVSIGEGGHLTLRLSHYALPQAGPTLGIFVNVGLIDTNFPQGQAGNPVGVFSAEPVMIEVSEDGLAWVSLGTITPDIPTNGYLDAAGPFAAAPGTLPSDFGLPFTGTLADFAGLPYFDAADPDILELLGGSGGGTWLDISATGLAQVGFVRFSVADDGNLFTQRKFELDAVVVAHSARGLIAPEPSSLVLALAAAAGVGALGRRRRRSRGRAAAAVLAAVLLATEPAGAQAGTLVSESFDTDPVAGGRAVIVGDASRYAHSAGDGTLTAHYDTGLPTSKMIWSLGQTLDQSSRFSLAVDVTIASANLLARSDAFAQVSFGLLNATTTGDDRAGGTGGNAYDLVAIDYFPNVSPLFGGPTVGPYFVQSNNGTGFFGRIVFAFGEETALDDEGPLPVDVPLRFEMDFDPASGILTLRMSSQGTPLDINSVGVAGLQGGFDGDDATSQVQIPLGGVFSVDSFGLLLWEDTFAGGTTTTRADLVYDYFEVVVVPEPAGWLTAAIGLAAWGIWRRRQRSVRLDGRCPGSH